MKWEELRQKYPSTWILFEALDAHSNEGGRIVDNISMLDSFLDGDDAFNAYRKLHKKEPQRELYIAHTKKENLEILERKWLGVRL